jgi:hypothetical protein
MKYSSQEGRRKEGFFFSFAFKGEPLSRGVQIPNDNLQIPNKSQIPITSGQNARLKF